MLSSNNKSRLSTFSLPFDGEQKSGKLRGGSNIHEQTEKTRTRGKLTRNLLNFS